MSPLHPHSQLPHCLSTVKRTQNVAAKAAALRLAQVMASQTIEDDEDEDGADMGFKFRVPTSAAVPVSSYSANLNNNQSSNTAATAALPRNSLSRPQISSSPSPSKSSLRTPIFIPPIEPPIARNRQPLSVLKRERLEKICI